MTRSRPAFRNSRSTRECCGRRLDLLRAPAWSSNVAIQCNAAGPFRSTHLCITPSVAISRLAFKGARLKLHNASTSLTLIWRRNECKIRSNGRKALSGHPRFALPCLGIAYQGLGRESPRRITTGHARADYGTRRRLNTPRHAHPRPATPRHNPPHVHGWGGWIEGARTVDDGDR